MQTRKEPTPKLTKGKRKKIIAQSLSLNLHAVGLHFVGSITGIEEIPVVNPTPPEREEQQLTDTRFRASVRGWINQAHQHRAQTLLDMRDERMAATLQRDHQCRCHYAQLMTSCELVEAYRTPKHAEPVVTEDVNVGKSLGA